MCGTLWNDIFNLHWGFLSNKLQIKWRNVLCVCVCVKRAEFIIRLFKLNYFLKIYICFCPSLRIYLNLNHFNDIVILMIDEPKTATQSHQHHTHLNAHIKWMWIFHKGHWRKNIYHIYRYTMALLEMFNLTFMYFGSVYMSLSQMTCVRSNNDDGGIKHIAYVHFHISLRRRIHAPCLRAIYYVSL